LNTKFTVKIFFPYLLILLNSCSFAFSTEKLGLQEKEFINIPYFYLNESEVVTQNGESIHIIDNFSLSLINLSIEVKKPIDLMDHYYQIQEVLLIKDLHITGMEYKKFGQIKIQTTNNKFIKFQDFQLSNQLKALKLFFQSNESNNLLKNFKTIDTRYKNKLAIGYF
tara:strand:- start:242 stop:742 length:501 start_codon:yes stop_codon:yes gene_type:complete